MLVPKKYVRRTRYNRVPSVAAAALFVAACIEARPAPPGAFAGHAAPVRAAGSPAPQVTVILVPIPTPAGAQAPQPAGAGSVAPVPPAAGSLGAAGAEMVVAGKDAAPVAIVDAAVPPQLDAAVAAPDAMPMPPAMLAPPLMQPPPDSARADYVALNHDAIVYAAQQRYSCLLEADASVPAQQLVDLVEGFTWQLGDLQFTPSLSVWEAHYNACRDQVSCNWWHCKPWWQ